MVEIRQLSAAEGRQHVSALADVLLDCVEGGASVSFMASITRAEAESFFETVIGDVERGDRILLAAFVDSRLAGTIQCIAAAQPNQPHRADIAKLLVHRSARKRGIATRLMRAIEEASLLRGKTLLVLDTSTGDAAEHLYVSLGWNKVGIIPNYALYPDGRLGATTVFYKQLP